MLVDRLPRNCLEKSGTESIGRQARFIGCCVSNVNRMGGPRAWKEIQKKQQEFHNSWDQEEQSKDDSDEEGNEKDVQKRDLYAEYGIDPETENERSQRAKGLGDTGELPGQEDVCFTTHCLDSLYSSNGFLS